MVTDADIKNVIVLEVGDTVSGVLSNNIDLFWSSYADKAFIAPRLQELYTRRRCIMAVLADPTFRDAVSFSMSGDLSMQLHERRDAMALRLREVNEQIREVERWETSLQPPVIEPIKATEIEVPPALRATPPSPVIDANDQRYRGDPYDHSEGDRPF